MAYEWLNPNTVEDYTSILDFEASVMIKSLLEDSKGGTVPLNPQVL